MNPLLNLLQSLKVRYLEEPKTRGTNLSEPSIGDMIHTMSKSRVQNRMEEVETVELGGFCLTPRHTRPRLGRI